MKDYWKTKGTNVLNVLVETYEPPKNPKAFKGLPELPDIIKQEIPFKVINVIQVSPTGFHIQIDTPDPGLIASLFIEWAESCKKTAIKYGIIQEEVK